MVRVKGFFIFMSELRMHNTWTPKVWRIRKAHVKYEPINLSIPRCPSYRYLQLHPLASLPDKPICKRNSSLTNGNLPYSVDRCSCERVNLVWRKSPLSGPQIAVNKRLSK